MIPLAAHLFAIVCYLASAGAAALPFARPVRSPVRTVQALLSVGIVLHVIGLATFAVRADAVPLSGIGPALSFAGLALAVSLCVVEWLAGEASLTVIGAPLAALPTIVALAVGLGGTQVEPAGLRGVWLFAHIALGFVGIAAFGAAGAAGSMYLIEHHELRSRNFAAAFRFFPPLATLDRVNHVAAVTAWFALSSGVALAVSYSFAYRQANVPQIMWGAAAWIAVSLVALGRMLRGWQAQRAAKYSSVAFSAILVLYVAFRVAARGAGKFL